MPEPTQTMSEAALPPEGTDCAADLEKNGWELHTDDGFLGLVGPVWARDVANGTGRFRFQAAPKHRNRVGVVQGGMLMTFADKALGTTARWDDLDRAQVTIQLDVQFIDSVQIGETVEINCRILKRTRRLAYMDGIMTVGARTVASARGVWRIMPAKSEDRD